MTNYGNWASGAYVQIKLLIADTFSGLEPPTPWTWSEQTLAHIWSSANPVVSSIQPLVSLQRLTYYPTSRHLLSDSYIPYTVVQSLPLKTSEQYFKKLIFLIVCNFDLSAGYTVWGVSDGAGAQPTHLRGFRYTGLTAERLDFIPNINLSVRNQIILYLQLCQLKVYFFYLSNGSLTKWI